MVNDFDIFIPDAGNLRSVADHAHDGSESSCHWSLIRGYIRNIVSAAIATAENGQNVASTSFWIVKKDWEVISKLFETSGYNVSIEFYGDSDTDDDDDVLCVECKVDISW